MTASSNIDDNILVLTEGAVSKLQSLIADEGNEDLKLRVFVTGGGCSGFQYGFTFDEFAADDDAVVEKEGVAVLLDSLSYSYLAGSKIDFVENLEGARFVVENPNADTTCGCGSSFSV